VAPPAPRDVALEALQIAAAPGPLADRGHQLLGLLHRAIGFDAAWIGLLDPERRAHDVLVDRGHDARVRSYLATPAVLAEMEHVGVEHWRQGPVRLHESLARVGSSPGWDEYLGPAGLEDSLSLGLFHPDGRYLGILALHTATSSQLDEASRDLLGTLGPTIAAAVDPLRSLSTVAGLVGRAIAGVVLTRQGNALPLPGLPSHALLRTGSSLLSAAATELDHHAHASFLFHNRGRAGPELQIKVTALSCPPDLPEYLLAVALISPAGETFGLTRRELEILGLLVEGWPNARIAAALFVSQSTVTTHVEHILAKLRVPTRAAAGVLALRLGIYIPLSLGAKRGRG
jgi:DNA-binding CsgD family transcriptional regulator